jgi:hypothetical protein
MKRTLIAKIVLPERSFAVGDDRLDRLLAFLTRDCGGNVSDCGIVEVRASSIFDDDCVPKNAANFAWTGPNFQSKTDVNQWIEWDFKASQIEPTHYSIRTHTEEAGGADLRHFWLSFQGESTLDISTNWHFCPSFEGKSTLGYCGKNEERGKNEAR